jgi:hypothetical protein
MSLIVAATSNCCESRVNVNATNCEIAVCGMPEIERCAHANGAVLGFLRERVGGPNVLAPESWAE